MVRNPDPAGLEELARALPRNVSAAERIASAAGGIALVAWGLTHRSVPARLGALAGLVLVIRGASGFCPVRQALSSSDEEGFGQARSAVLEHDEGLTVETAVIIERPAEEIYSFWRRLENLPLVMEHLESVREIDATRSHWIAKGPARRSVEWDAEIINDIPGEMIGWRSLPDSEVANAGSVHFSPLTGGRGTEVRVRLRYEPKFGRAGALVAKLIREEPGQQIARELRRLKARMEGSGRTASEAVAASRDDRAARL
ncbi:MAG TPA: SRPBCC family protein [Thermoanaerobaculia bacterium]|nr:SRPBCC family protein [Thermoanaerobaculia bacterium]